MAALSDDARMYLQPLRKPKEEVWYGSQPLGKNSIANIIRQMFETAEIGGRHTNHSVRRTMVSTALESGIHETRVMQVRGRPLDIQGGGARKNFEINKFLLKNCEMNKVRLNSGEKNICTQVPCISSVTENV